MTLDDAAKAYIWHTDNCPKCNPEIDAHGFRILLKTSVQFAPIPPDPHTPLCDIGPAMWKRYVKIQNQSKRNHEL